MDLENLIALQAAAYRLQSLSEHPATLSTDLQVVGLEVEQRAQALIAEVQALRGLQVAATNGHVEHDDEPPPLPDASEGLNGAMVRDTMLRFKSGFLISELASALKCTNAEVKKFVTIWERGGHVKPTGFRVGRQVQYEYVKPQAPGPVNRPKVAPPEVLVPREKIARGEPVRLNPNSKSQVVRKINSTPHKRRSRTRRDAEYAKQQAAKKLRES